MDRNFARSLSLVLKSEGGWSDNPADPGGATMKGVTIANFRRYVKPDGTKADLRAITDEQIATVYRKFYWDAVAGDELPDGLDYAVFDFAVNSGPNRAAKYLQAACGPAIAQDGKIGPSTIAAVNAKPAGVLIDTICDARLAFLERLPTWPRFGKGWSARVASVRRDALMMSGLQQAQAATPAAPMPPAVAPASVPVPKPANKAAGLAAALALTAMALAGFWHHITAYIGGFFQ
jgi:lysozyme family protein